MLLIVQQLHKHVENSSWLFFFIISHVHLFITQRHSNERYIAEGIFQISMGH